MVALGYLGIKKAQVFNLSFESEEKNMLRYGYELKSSSAWRISDCLTLELNTAASK